MKAIHKDVVFEIKTQDDMDIFMKSLEAREKRIISKIKNVMVGSTDEPVRRRKKRRKGERVIWQLLLPKIEKMVTENNMTPGQAYFRIRKVRPAGVHQQKMKDYLNARGVKYTTKPSIRFYKRRHRVNKK